MKNYLLCILIALSSSLEAQTLPTQIQTYEWNGALFDWVLRTAESYQYDERDSIRVTDNQSNWFGPSRYIVFKDENGKVIETLSLWLDENDEWVNANRSRTTINANGRESSLIEIWNEDHWEPQYLNHTLTTELPDGVETDRETQSLINGVWTNSSRYNSKQNNEGLELFQRHYQWENNQWVKTYHWENQYNDNGDLIYSEYGSEATLNLTRIRREYAYNAAGQILSIREDISHDEPTVWIPNTEIKYEYDSQGRTTLYEHKWIVQNRLRIDEKVYSGDTTIWSTFQSRNNNPLEGVSRRWSVEGPEKYSQAVYWRIDMWENSTWVRRTEFRKTPTFDRYDNLVRIDQENFEDGEWKPSYYQTYNWGYHEDGKPIKMVCLEYNYHTQRQTPIQKMIWRYEDRKVKSDRPLIEIAPNPSTGPLTISFHSAPVLPIRWEILDETGRSVRMGNISEQEQKLGLELFHEELQFGFYILQIQYEDGSTVAKKWQKI